MTTHFNWCRELHLIIEELSSIITGKQLTNDDLGLVRQF
jgi:hypothetical protein